MMGNSDLILDGTPKVAIGGTNHDQFSMAIQPLSPVSGPGSTDFTLEFSPTSAGEKSVKISIENNDAGKDPNTFTVTGTAVGPEIRVTQLGVGEIAVGGGTSTLVL
jgi:hypothetical protein